MSTEPKTRFTLYIKTKSPVQDIPQFIRTVIEPLHIFYGSNENSYPEPYNEKGRRVFNEWHMVFINCETHRTETLPLSCMKLIHDNPELSLFRLDEELILHEQIKESHTMRFSDFVTLEQKRTFKQIADENQLLRLKLTEIEQHNVELTKQLNTVALSVVMPLAEQLIVEQEKNFVADCERTKKEDQTTMFEDNESKGFNAGSTGQPPTSDSPDYIEGYNKGVMVYKFFKDLKPSP